MNNKEGKMYSRVHKMLIVITMTFVALTVQSDILFAAYEFSGRGQQVTRKFTLQPGLYVFGMKHTGTSNFVIRPMSTDGGKYSSLVNEIGRFEGSTAFSVRETKTFLLNVDADGNWSISIGKPGRDPHARYIKGVGQKATKLIALKEGLYIFKMKHSGKSNFIIRPYRSDGRRYSSLVNEIGHFNGSKAETLAEGEYLFQVDADGQWEITIEKQ